MSYPVLSIVILAFNEAKNLGVLIPQVKAIVGSMVPEHEMLVLDGNSSDNSVQVARSLGCRVVMQREPGYGNAFKQALMEAKGDFSMTIDADCSHDPEFIKKLWERRDSYHLVIASRYIKGGSADMPISRRFLSILLNRIYATVLALPYKDLSSGFRLYKMDSVKDILKRLCGKNFDILLEVLFKIHCEGFNISEVPFCFRPRHRGRSTVQLWKFGISYFKTLHHLWQLRIKHGR